jgi:hypothetical protein
MKSEKNVGTNSQVIANNRGGVESIKVASPYHVFGVHYVNHVIDLLSPHGLYEGLMHWKEQLTLKRLG